MRERFVKKFKLLKEAGETMAMVMFDEIACQYGLQFHHRLNCLVGMDAMQDNTTFLEIGTETEVTEQTLKEEKSKIGKLADEVKFMTTNPRPGLTLIKNMQKTSCGCGKYVKISRRSASWTWT